MFAKKLSKKSLFGETCIRIYLYEIQLTQELKPIDHLKRREFVNFIEGKPDGFSEKNHLQS